MNNRIFENQIWHILAIFLSVIVFSYLSMNDSELTKGSLFGIKTSIWLWIAILTPIIHQLYVTIIWRYELYKKTFTKKFGFQKAFKIYTVGFSILFVFRLISIIFLAFSNKYTLDINPLYTYTIASIITPFVIYLFYSVKKYFTIERAYGIDHFDKNYNVPYVKKGIFKYTNNGMYVVGLAVLYLPGLLLLSEAAILVAFFNHIYIWVHYYTTEQSDMKTIYGNTP
jgi:hypothetical protein